jgi:multidrug efflux pump subunit AcrA (membrane-fusion protein)
VSGAFSYLDFPAVVYYHRPMDRTELFSLFIPSQNIALAYQAGEKKEKAMKYCGTADPMLKTGALLLFMITVIAGVSGCEKLESSPTAAPKQPPAVKVSVVEVQPTTIRDVLVLPGVAEALHDVTLGSERDGRVEWIGPREGQRVKKGQLLAKIDVAALQEALDRFKAAHKLAQDVAERRSSLHKGMIVSQEEMEKAETERMLAVHNLREAKVNFDKGFVHAPLTELSTSGRLSRANLSEEAIRL